MPGIIDSAPDCVTRVNGALPADDSADFILQAAYEECAGFMTFGPGSIYGDEGAGAAVVHRAHLDRHRRHGAMLVDWVILEHRRLVRWTASNGAATLRK